MLRNSNYRWGDVSQTLHWLVSAAILFLLITGWLHYFAHLMGVEISVISIHKTIGLLLLALTVVRVVWRWFSVLPTAHHSISNAVRRWIVGVQYALLVLTLVMPLSGWTMSTSAGHRTNIIIAHIAMPGVPRSHELSGLTEQIHFWGACVLIMFLLFHLWVAVWHHLINKDPSLIRITPKWIWKMKRKKLLNQK